MAGHGFQWLLRVYVFLMLARPLSPSSRPEGDMGTLRQLPEDIKQQDTASEMTPFRVIVAVSLAGFVLELLLMGIVLRWCLGRRVQRHWEEEEHQSPSVSAEPCCCQGRGCCEELLQALRQNHALMQLSLCHSSLQRPRQWRPAKDGLWKRRRLHFSPQL